VDAGVTVPADFDRETGRICGCGQPLTRWVIIRRIKLWFWCRRCDSKGD